MSTDSNLKDKLKNNRFVNRYTDINVYKEEFKNELAALKKEPSNIKEAFLTLRSDSLLRKRQFVESKKYKDVLLMIIPIFILFCASAILCTLEEGAFDLYMSVVLPFFVIIFFIFAFCFYYNCSIMYTTFTSVLILFGVCFQVLLESRDENATYDNVEMLFIFAFLGIVVGLIMMLVLNYAYNFADKRFIILGSILISVFIYLILFLFGTDVQGTKAWISLGGGRTFQLTEITKVFAIIGLSAAFTDKERSYKLRLFNALIVLGINAFFLAAISELGTLVVISIAFFALGIVFLPKYKEFVLILIMCMLILGAATGVSAVCHSIVHSADASASQESDSSETDGTDAEEAESTESSSSSEDTTIGDDAEDSSEKAVRTVPGGIAGKVIRKLSAIYDKVYTRIELVRNPDSVEEKRFEEGYQAYRAQRALMVTDWLTTDPEFEQYVPIISSDYIFVFALMKIGIIGSILIICILLILLSETVIYASKSSNYTEAATAIGFICCIVVQSIITAASSVGMVPTVGLTFAFLSSGGSAALVNYAMTLFILYSMRNDISVHRDKNKITRRKSV